MEDTTDTTLYVQHPARALRGGLKEGRERGENRVALKEQQKIPRRRQNEIGNADYIRNERVWWLRKGREGVTRKTHSDPRIKVLPEAKL